MPLFRPDFFIGIGKVSGTSFQVLLTFWIVARVCRVFVVKMHGLEGDVGVLLVR